MANNVSPVVRKLISVRTFVQPRLLLASAMSVAASLLLGVSLICTAGIVCLILQPANSQNGLLHLLPQLSNSATGRLPESIIQSVPWLHQNVSALTTLTIAFAAGMAFRWLLRALANSLVTANSLAVVQRLRQHIHRKAIRLEPADLSGEQSQATDRLFREATQSLESSAR